MTITLDPQTEARLRALAEDRHLPVETCLAELVERDSAHLSPSTDENASLIQDGPFLVISAGVPTGWDAVQAIDDMREERARHVLGL